MTAAATPDPDRPVRTIRQLCLEIARREGLPKPDCSKCDRRKECFLMQHSRSRELKLMLRRRWRAVRRRPV